MSLLQMSLAGGVMILVITVIRALAMDHVPKRTFPVLWGIALFRLLIPLSLPSALSIYSLLKRTPAPQRRISPPRQSPPFWQDRPPLCPSPFPFLKRRFP